MAWKQRITEGLSDLLRFTVRAALITDGIAIAVASVYVIVKFCWFTVRFLDRWMFAEPW